MQNHIQPSQLPPLTLNHRTMENWLQYCRTYVEGVTKTVENANVEILYNLLQMVEKIEPENSIEF